VGQGELSGGGLVAGVRAAPVYLWRYAWIIVSPGTHAAAYAAPTVDGTHLALAWAGVAAVVLALVVTRPPTLTFALAWFAVALPHLQTARDIDGDKPEVRLGLATAYDQLGHAAEAEAAARAAIAAADGDARPHALLGGILAKKGDLAGAAAEAVRARTLNPDL